jgi:hypothetical protein
MQLGRTTTFGVDRLDDLGEPRRRHGHHVGQGDQVARDVDELRVLVEDRHLIGDREDVIVDVVDKLRVAGPLLPQGHAPGS